MERVADHYALPSIHLGMEVARLEQEGKLVFTGQLPEPEAEKAKVGGPMVFSSDGVHPHLKTGHPLYFEAIVRSMPLIERVPASVSRSLPPPLDGNNWEGAGLVPFHALERSAGWKKLADQGPQAAIDQAKKGGEFWMADKPGEAISFRFKGTLFGLYGLQGPDACQFQVSVDDRPRSPPPCSMPGARRDAIGSGLDASRHPARRRTPRAHRNSQGAADKAAILAQRQETIRDPEEFNRTVLYVGDFMVLGTLVEG